jgi:hypothetical protein
MAELSLADQDLRGNLTRAIARLGHAPSIGDLAAEVGLAIEAVDAALLRLHEAHALLLHPHLCEPWVVHPFALSPGSCWVETSKRGYWANCLYCAFGIAAALRADARVTTRLGGEGRTALFRVAAGKLLDCDGVFHFSLPARCWWNNVIHACATFQPFASEAEVASWCRRHALPRGYVMSLKTLWRFASDWYGGYLQEPWRRRGPEQIRALFEAHGLTGEFWSW